MALNKDRHNILVGYGRTSGLTHEEQQTATREELFASAERYAMKILGNLLKRYNNMCRDDINLVMQEGMVGLWRATKTFDPSLGTDFVCWAHSAILNYAHNELKKQWIARTRIHDRAEDDYYTVKDKMGINEGRYVPHDGLDKRDMARLIDLAGLTDRERHCIIKFFGLFDQERQNMEGIAIDVGVTKQRIGQSLTKAKEKIMKVIIKEERKN